MVESGVGVQESKESSHRCCRTDDRGWGGLPTFYITIL